MKTPHWNRLIRCLNKYHVGNIVNQKNLCKKIKAKFNDTSRSLISKYIFYLESIGLIKIESAQTFRIIEEVSDHLNLEHVRLWVATYQRTQDDSIECLMRHFDAMEKLDKIKNKTLKKNKVNVMSLEKHIVTLEKLHGGNYGTTTNTKKEVFY